MKRRRVTMQDVANAAEVSKTAVSFAFSEPSRISESTVRHILKVADDLGYSHDPAARMLRTRKTNSLGLLLPQDIDAVFQNPYYTAFLQGIGQTCHREGYTVLLVPPLRGSMLKAIPYAAVDGFIVSGLEADRGEVRALRQRDIPFVLVDSEYHDDVPSVEVDEVSGMRAAVRHLLELGHRRLAVLAIETGIAGGPEKWVGPVRRRIDGALDALRGCESATYEVLEVPCTTAGGERAFAELWAGPQRPTAFVCLSDVIALGVLARARSMGVAVPSDVSVTGFDDLQEASLASPALTTVRQPIASKGRLAADYLIEALAGTTPPSTERQVLPTSLLIRESTAAPAHN